MTKISYTCKKCDFSGTFSKERVKCPDCGKMALVENELTTVAKADKVAPKRKNERQAIFTGNTWKDDGKLFAEDKKITKIISKIGNVSERTRGNNIKTKNCDRCNKEFRVYGNEYLCDKCVMGR